MTPARLFMSAVLLAIGLGGSGCLLYPSNGESPSPSSIRVDGAAGDDATGDGTYAKPFKTISRGLLAAKDGNTVHVAAGVYGAGETFPLILPAGVVLEGENVASGATEIQGSGPFVSPSLERSVLAAVRTGPRSWISRVTIRAAGAVGIWCEEGSEAALVTDSHVADSDTGIVVSGEALSYLDSNTISGSTWSAVEVLGQSHPTLRRNTLTGNGTGVAIRDQAVPDLGSSSEPGGNVIAGNLACDLMNATAGVVEARGNTWDHDQYLIAAATSCSGGADVVNTVSGTGAILFQDVPPGTDPIFTGCAPIATSSPPSGAIIRTTTPGMAWAPTGSALVLAGIFTEPIAVAAGHITNGSALVWAWHSGLGAGRDGAVAFTDGVAPLEGRLDRVEAAVPLTPGRTYYWSVWAWDSTGTKVVAASALQFFAVGN